FDGGLLDVVPRALQLKRFRDATVEQQLTGLYSKVLPQDRACWSLPNGGRTFINARIFPLELKEPVEIQKRLLEGERAGFKEIVYQTIADGCRASMEGMLPSLVAGRAADRTDTDWPDWPLAGDKAPAMTVKAPPPPPPASIELGEWPPVRATMKGTERPLVSLLFGGGVFRGVFHMGVINALNEVGLYPDIVAGS